MNDTALFFILMGYSAVALCVCVSPVFGDEYLPNVLGSLSWPLSLPVVVIVRTAIGRPVLTGRDRVPRATARKRRTP